MQTKPRRYANEPAKFAANTDMNIYRYRYTIAGHEEEAAGNPKDWPVNDVDSQPD